MRPCDALITGFVRSPAAGVERSLAPHPPTCSQEGIIRAIHYVDMGQSRARSLCRAAGGDGRCRGALPGCRSREAEGNGIQRGIVYQVENLRAAAGASAGR